MEGYQAAIEIEKVITEISRGDDESMKFARRSIRAILLTYAGLEVDKGLTLSDSIERITKEGDKKTLRNISIFVIRLNSVLGFFPRQKVGGNVDAKIVSLIEPKVSDFYERFDIDVKSQTYEKLDKIYQVHDYCIEKLKSLVRVPDSIDAISSEKQIILKSLGEAVVKSYLSPYEIVKIRSSVEAIIRQLSEFSIIMDSSFNWRLKELIELLEMELDFCSSSVTFVTNDYYKPFLETVKRLVIREAEKSKEKFVCHIRSRKGKVIRIEKKYPLHKSGEELRIFIPLYNPGPGTANKVSATVSVSGDSVIVSNPEVVIGDVAPGDFVVPFAFFIFEPISKVTFDILVEWKMIGSNEDQIEEFQVSVEAQSADVDWDSLSLMNPYGLEIAVGEDFYGRKDVLRQLVSKVEGGKSESSYITGQRRVGKSSLAKAFEDALLGGCDRYSVLYIECGDFKYPEPVGTINALGEEIAHHLISNFPDGIAEDFPVLGGSLAPLARLVSKLDKFCQGKVFVIIIDEFDEINPELYRFGELAETFFLNLRSLSGKRNVCFCLIGAEKMSFVMSSQGEKLNRFSRVSLDAFSPEEWQDYEALVKANLLGSITWLDAAVRTVYSVTNGHPYFTKQICAKVFSNAVADRDSEISPEEVEYSVKQLIDELDVNAFQHFWRDGIFAEGEDAEIIALKRCRALIGLARTIRRGMDLSSDNIINNIYSSQLPDAEVIPLLTDFCRRGVLSGDEMKYEIVIPFFERWLVNQGFNCLIADQFADDLAEKRRIEEDEAYVTDAELEVVIDDWPAYRGVKITVQTVRNWMSQIDSHIQQRLLFKLISNIRFFSEKEVRDYLKSSHEKIKSKINLVVQKTKSQRRKDVWVTYVDGAGKSGSQYANYYAEENLISTTCVKEISEVNQVCEKLALPEDLSTIIIVDDFVGSGDGLSQNIRDFYNRNGDFVKKSNISVFVVVVCATTDGEDKLRCAMSEVDSECDLVVAESLGRKHFSFDKPIIWLDDNEMYQAKEICQRLGTDIDRKNPLGYRDQGLLVVFSRNCPNNTLPIIHSRGKSSANNWVPLFERVKH